MLAASFSVPRIRFLPKFFPRSCGQILLPKALVCLSLLWRYALSVTSSEVLSPFLHLDPPRSMMFFPPLRSTSSMHLRRLIFLLMSSVDYGGRFTFHARRTLSQNPQFFSRGRHCRILFPLFRLLERSDLGAILSRPSMRASPFFFSFCSVLFFTKTKEGPFFVTD